MENSASQLGAPVGIVNPHTLFEEIGEDKELFATLIQTACNDLPQYMAQVRAAAAVGDHDKLKQAAHAMKTTLAHWEAKTAVGLAVAIELACRQGRQAEAVAAVPKLEQALVEVLQALQELEKKQ